MRIKLILLVKYYTTTKVKLKCRAATEQSSIRGDTETEKKVKQKQKKYSACLAVFTTTRSQIWDRSSVFLFEISNKWKLYWCRDGEPDIEFALTFFNIHIQSYSHPISTSSINFTILNENSAVLFYLSLIVSYHKKSKQNKVHLIFSNYEIFSVQKI